MSFAGAYFGAHGGMDAYLSRLTADVVVCLPPPVGTGANATTASTTSSTVTVAAAHRSRVAPLRRLGGQLCGNLPLACARVAPCP